MAHVIASDGEALQVAQEMATVLAGQADDRDRLRRLPADELDRLSASGLLGITVPREHGGAGVSVATLAEVVRLLGTADGSVAQIPQSHFVFLDALRRQGTPAQCARWFAEALAGRRFANAQTERSGATVTDDSTALVPDGAGGWVLSGEKYYCTGALFADWLVVRAVLGDEPAPRPKVLVYLERGTPGVTVQDDWDGMGQRTTASGTVRLDDVRVTGDAVVPFGGLFDGPTTYGARAQVLHAAIDAGLARGALTAAVTAVARARPWFESGATTAAGDPLVVQQAGEAEITVRSAEALLREAARAVDDAESDPTDDSTARASIATAVAKVAAARAAVDAASVLFELGGTRTAAAGLNLSRHWRDARTHTLHDPARWKVQHVGRWLLSGTPPPRHGQL